jgi:Spx/MgsR family transcriptional regulator
MKKRTLTVYGIPNCSSVKKAQTWLTEHGMAYEFHDFKKLGVPATELDRWMKAAGWERLLNRKGTTWRQLDTAVQASVHDAGSARAVMLDKASVIKRPVIDWPDGQTTVGYTPEDWPV